MIPQDPLSSLNPAFTVGWQVAETIWTRHEMGKEAAHRRAVELLEAVGIPRAAEQALRFPHEFSGGMRQRVVIAIAMANDPDVIIADEPTTALDVTIQAQVLEALRAAREQTGASMILITHDLGVVAGMADRVMVMYAGKPVETGAGRRRSSSAPGCRTRWACSARCRGWTWTAPRGCARFPVRRHR